MGKESKKKGNKNKKEKVKVKKVDAASADTKEECEVQAVSDPAPNMGKVDVASADKKEECEVQGPSDPAPYKGKLVFASDEELEWRKVKVINEPVRSMVIVHTVGVNLMNEQGKVNAAFNRFGQIMGYKIRFLVIANDVDEFPFKRFNWLIPKILEQLPNVQRIAFHRTPYENKDDLPVKDVVLAEMLPELPHFETLTLERSNQFKVVSTSVQAMHDAFYVRYSMQLKSLGVSSGIWKAKHSYLNWNKLEELHMRKILHGETLQALSLLEVPKLKRFAITFAVFSSDSFKVLLNIVNKLKSLRQLRISFEPFCQWKTTPSDPIIQLEDNLALTVTDLEFNLDYVSYEFILKFQKLKTLHLFAGPCPNCLPHYLPDEKWCATVTEKVEIYGDGYEAMGMDAKFCEDIALNRLFRSDIWLELPSLQVLSVMKRGNYILREDYEGPLTDTEEETDPGSVVSD